MKYAELRRQAAEAQQKTRDLQRELELTRSIQTRVLGDVPRQHVVEFAVRQRTDEMSFTYHGDNPSFRRAIESDAVRTLLREASLNGFVVSHSEFDPRDRVQVTTFRLFVVKP